MTAITEEAAKEKWCPFARVPIPVWSVASNKTSEGSTKSGATCIGAYCMAWRWKGKGESTGFCGLAGD